MFIICAPVIAMKSIGQSSNMTKLQIDSIKEIVKLSTYNLGYLNFITLKIFSLFTLSAVEQSFNL